MIPRPLLLLTFAGALLGSGCSVLSPKKDPTRFYELTGSVKPGPVNSTARSETLVLNVQLAGYLQNTSLAQRIAPNQLAFFPFDQWAQPLSEGISQVLRDDLAARTDLAVVNANSSYVIRDATRVDVIIRQFDVLPGDRVQIAALWQIRTNLTSSPVRLGEFRQDRPFSPNLKSLQDAVATLSQLLEDLSQAILKDLP
jgi:uncharacterized lipoprotein YmbA